MSIRVNLFKPRMNACAPRPAIPSVRKCAPRPTTVARFTENSLITDLMPLLMPQTMFSPRTPSPLSRSMQLRTILSDVQEREDGYEIKCDLPGVPKENIRVDHHDDVLNISVDHKQEKEEEKEEQGVTWHRMERQTSFAKRSMRLPPNADLTKIVARYNDGVLTVLVPKKEEPEPDSKRIEIQ